MRTLGGLTCIASGTMLLTLAACGGGGDGLASPETPRPREPSVPTDPPASELSLVGEYLTVPTGGAGGTASAEFRRWGIWGGIPREDAAACTAIGCPPAGDTIFLAYLDHDAGGRVSATVVGERSGTSPQVGSAFWVGDVLGHEGEEVAGADGTSVTAYEAVRGAARLEADFEAATVDMEFTLLGEGRSDLSWDGLAMEAGAFGTGDGSIEGWFYGREHEGAAGTFTRAGLAGVFGMLRTWPVEPGEPGTGAAGGVSIEWGPRLGSSGLSALSGGNDEFGPTAAQGLARAARAVPNGASQSSLVDGDGRTADEMSVEVVRDGDGSLVHEVTDGARIVVRVPFSLPRQGLDLALFTDLMPGIEPDLSSYPHEVLGVWAWDAGDGEAGVFWSRSPPVPPVEFGAASPIGTATYEGDAVGLHAAEGMATKFLADVEPVADFSNRTVGGEVDGFRSFADSSLGDLSVTLGETEFSPQGDPFSGDTTAGGVPGSGKWGARWSDGVGRTMGGTFGFAADDGSVAVLGAFTACSCIPPGDDPVPLPGQRARTLAARHQQFGVRRRWP